MNRDQLLAAIEALRALVQAMPDESPQESLRERRLMQGHTLQHLAGLAGLTVGNLSRIERGEQFPRPASAQRLAHALGLPAARLYEACAAAAARSAAQADQQSVVNSQAVHSADAERPPCESPATNGDGTLQPSTPVGTPE